jgi:hypothetical protein
LAARTAQGLHSLLVKGGRGVLEYFFLKKICSSQVFIFFFLLSLLFEGRKRSEWRTRRERERVRVIDDS